MERSRGRPADGTREAKDMNRLQLATLLSWAGDSGIQGRKRLQKVVFFLQQAGCPLDCQYTLHHFGPYSRDVADTCDEMVAAGVVGRKEGKPNTARAYTHPPPPATPGLLAQQPRARPTPLSGLARERIGPRNTPNSRRQPGSS